MKERWVFETSKHEITKTHQTFKGLTFNKNMLIYMKVMKIMGSMIVNNLKYTKLLGPLKMRGKTNHGQDYKIVLHFHIGPFKC